MENLKRIVCIHVPQGKLRRFDRELAEYFGFPKKRMFKRQWDYHHAICRAIKSKYPGARLSIVSDPWTSEVYVSERLVMK